MQLQGEVNKYLRLWRELRVDYSDPMTASVLIRSAADQELQNLERKFLHRKRSDRLWNPSKLQSAEALAQDRGGLNKTTAQIN